MGELSRNHSTRFGRQLRSHFLFDDDYININHGSYGTYPACIRDELRKWQDRHEARPDQFIRYDFGVELEKSRAALSTLLHAPLDTVVFVPNATTGVNTVLRNLVFAPGDVIVYFATIYGACELTVRYVCETTPARAARVEYEYPVADEELVRRFREVVTREQEEGRRVRVAVFDTVVSMPGVRMPFEMLARACRELGVLSCVDGAHGVGHVAIDLTELDPDFFVSNCHKWLFVPRGCAVFYVPVRNQHLMRSTLPTSHGFKPLPLAGEKVINPLPPSAESEFITNFTYTGTLDCSPYLCIPAALSYRASLGGEDAIRTYCFDLARRGGARAAQLLGTEVLENEAGSLGQCCFSNVRLPLDLKACQALAEERRRRAQAGESTAVVVVAARDDEVLGAVKAWATQVMVKEYGGFVALVEYRGTWWARLSAQVYLEMADFEWAAGVLKKVCERALEGEWLES